jgi:mannose-6-phosphate isomerase-like protein (cupin superfamily)/catechol 2,3-dioxygenase-like lactoylglutathione lyase family enzyme
MRSTISTGQDRPDISAERRLSSEPETSRAWWFLGTLAVLRNPEGAPRTPAVIELTVPPGGSPPRHIHEALDDAFLMLDGEVVVRCGEQTVVARAGTYVCVPAGVEHTFRVTSPVPARMLQVHNDDSFLALIEAVGTPTRQLTLPPSGEFDVDLDTLVRLNAEHDSRIVGPSLEDADARSFVGPAEEDVVRVAAPGPVNHIALNVSDLRRSVPWYVQALGLVRADGEVAEDGSGHVVLLSPTGGWLLSLTGSGAHGGRPGVDHIAIGCRDRCELVELRDQLAGRAAEPGTITDAPYGSGFVVRDPDGLELELFAPAAPSAPSAPDRTP